MIDDVVTDWHNLHTKENYHGQDKYGNKFDTNANMFPHPDSTATDEETWRQQKEYITAHEADFAESTRREQMVMQLTGKNKRLALYARAQRVSKGYAMED